MNLTLIQNHGLKYVNKIDDLRGDDMNDKCKHGNTETTSKTD